MSGSVIDSVRGSVSRLAVLSGDSLSVGGITVTNTDPNEHVMQ